MLANNEIGTIQPISEISKIVKDESKIINQNNFDNENNMKISHGKKQHVILKII